MDIRSERTFHRIKKYYDLGARYITLCHSRNNDICDSSTDPDGPEHNGLSRFGEEVVKEMNRLGMMVDVSHISDKSFYDVIEIIESAGHCFTFFMQGFMRKSQKPY